MEQNCELGDFLRSRRARLRPEDAGTAFSGGVRRVPGLRREEVAHLAGVSTDYYARLEQGRHPHVSETVLEAVARALRLDDTERGYLFELARPKSPGPGRRAAARAPRVRPAIHQMLDALDSVSPALVLNHRTDILAVNHLAKALITDFDALPHHDRNFARFVLLHPAARDLFRDWDRVAEEFVSHLRLAAGRHPDDRLLSELVEELAAEVPQVTTWWAVHRVDQCAHGVQRLDHSVVGELTLSYETLALPAEPDLTICLYTAEPGSASEETLRILASRSALMGVRAPRSSEAPSS
ncbi:MULTISPECIES: helix-turn-helix transcriptional regulator [unclassified Streptomyces]|uniref:helix-turn-helix transcriptional regulator n=1 Tax=unclassified Streptomyces TaxID=2593676 RepID=UPI002DD88BEB|nr:helix-turn-helix transcriptional regulator [Streptomyces sp. NBC_01761]WSC52050.1 helix-turn-helix transcriptional regulator [Streptomyces sp. NBC_01761]WSF82898.1 helix-turn-helix transcriptional regulator [Streptomyces sp. NBC_01744]